MIQYNVKHKGNSIGMTFSKQEALEWCTSPDHSIIIVYWKG